MQKKNANYLTNRNIKCYQHNEELSYLDLSRVCQDRSRLKCNQCKLNQCCVTIQQFNNLCEQFSLTSKNTNDQIFNTYQEIYSNIQKQINLMNEKIQNIIFKPQYDKNFINYLESYINIIRFPNSKQKDIGLQEFEFITQSLSEQVDFEGLGNKIMIKKQELDDQKQAEQNQYLDLILQLNQMISNFVLQNNLINNQKQNINIQQINQQINQFKQNENDGIQIFDQDGQILSCNSKLPIADIKLNYDQTILAARLCEPCTIMLFWKKDVIQNKWIKYQILQCFTKSLVYFTFSKCDNILINSGSDIDKLNRSILKIWVLKNNQWTIKQTYLTQVQPGLGSQRISCIVLYPIIETQIFFSEGNRVVVLEQLKHGLNFEFKYCVEKSKEVITYLQISNDRKILAVGGWDQKVTLWKIEDLKLVQCQQLKLYNTPKSIIFSQNNQELIISTKDGLVHCFSNKNQKQNEYQEYQETQKIFNNIAKIRTIQFNYTSSILAIGGETNVLQLWQQNQKNEWICYQEFKQDKFIEAICFANSQEFVFATNNNDIYIHQLF